MAGLGAFAPGITALGWWLHRMLYAATSIGSIFACPKMHLKQGSMIWLNIVCAFAPGITALGWWLHIMFYAASSIGSVLVQKSMSDRFRQYSHFMCLNCS